MIYFLFGGGFAMVLNSTELYYGRCSDSLTDFTSKLTNAAEGAELPRILHAIVAIFSIKNSFFNLEQSFRFAVLDQTT